MGTFVYAEDSLGFMDDLLEAIEFSSRTRVEDDLELWTVFYDCNLKLKKKAEKLARDRKLSCLRGIGVGLHKLLLREALYERKRNLRQLKRIVSSELLLDVGQRNKLFRFFPEEDPGYLKALYGFTYILFGFGATRTLVRTHYQVPLRIAEIENPCVADEHISLEIVELILKEYAWKIFPITRGGGMMVRSQTLMMDQILQPRIRHAFDAPREEAWWRIIARQYEQEGFETIKLKLINSFPQTLENLRALVQTHAPEKVQHFEGKKK